MVRDCEGAGLVWCEDCEGAGLLRVPAGSALAFEQCVQVGRQPVAGDGAP